MVDIFTRQELILRAGESGGPPFGDFGPFGFSDGQFPTSWASSWSGFPFAATASVTVTATDTVTTSANAADSTHNSTSNSPSPTPTSSKSLSGSSTSSTNGSAAISSNSGSLPASATSLGIPSAFTGRSTDAAQASISLSDTGRSQLTHQHVIIIAVVSSVVGIVSFVAAVLLIQRCKRGHRNRVVEQLNDTVVPFDTGTTTVGNHSSSSLSLRSSGTSAEPTALYEPQNEEKRDLESGPDFDRTSRPSPIATVLSTGGTVGAPHPPPVLDLPSVAPQRPSPETRVRSAPVLRMTGLRQEIDGGVRLVLGVGPNGEPGGISEEPDEEEVLPPPYEARFSV